jgi:hypothetical protein
MLRLFIRELIKEAIENLENKQIVIEKNDLNSIFIKNEENKLYSIKDLNLYCVFTHISKWSLCKDKVLENLLNNKAKANTFEIADVIKKDINLKSGYTLTMSDEDRTFWRDFISIQIAKKFEKENIEGVMYAHSTSSMPKEIAKHVANYLNVKCYNALKKATDPEKFDINWDRFNRWKIGKSEAEIRNFERQLFANLSTVRNKIEKKQQISIARDFLGNRKDFFTGIHEINVSGLKGNILIIDDNVDSGATFDDIKNTLKETNPDVTPFFAAGFKINRTKTEEVKQPKESEKEKIEKEKIEKEKKQRIANILKKNDSQNTSTISGVDRIERYNKSLRDAGQKEIIDFSYLTPYDYHVGDIINTQKFGLGFIEEVDPANSNLLVNFKLDLKKLKYTPKTKNNPREVISESLQMIMIKILSSIRG